MKTKRSIFIISVIILIILIGFQYLSQIKQKYYTNFNNIQNWKINLHYTLPYELYFDQHFECPKSMSETTNLFYKKNNYESRFYKDWLSKEDSFIVYLPLYNRINKKREGFCLLSSGIDGYINNHINLEKDTLFLDNFVSKIKIYNDSINWLSNLVTHDRDSSFNTYLYFFGKKDYLITCFNCIQNYIHQVDSIESLQNISEEIARHKNRKNQKYGYKGVVASFTADTLIFKDRNFMVKSIPYNRNQQLSIGDSIAFVGTLVTSSRSKKEIIFKNCVRVSLNYRLKL